MQTAPARPRATLSVVRVNTPQIGFGAGRGGSPSSQADIVQDGPHAWAVLPDIARMAAELGRAEELIGLAYMAYDVLGSTEWDCSADAGLVNRVQQVLRRVDAFRGPLPVR